MIACIDSSSISAMVASPGTLTDLLGHLGGGLHRHLAAALLGHLLAGLLGHLGAVLLGHLTTGLLGHLDWHLLTVLLGHLGALLGWLLDRDLGAALAGNFLALLAISAITPVTPGARADLLVAGGALLLVASLVDCAAHLLIGGGALGVVAGLIAGAALLLVTGAKIDKMNDTDSSYLISQYVPALGLVRGGALLLVAGGAFLLIRGLVSSLVHGPAFWCVTSLDPRGQGDTGDHKLKYEAVIEDNVIPDRGY